MYRSPAPYPTGSELQWSNLTHPLRHGIPTNRRAAHISANSRAPRVRFNRKSTNRKRFPKYSYQSQSTYSLPVYICWLYLFEFNMVLGSLPCTSLQQQGKQSHNALYITMIVFVCFRFFHTKNIIIFQANYNIIVIAEFVHGQGPERLYENTCRNADPINRILVIYW